MNTLKQKLNESAGSPQWIPEPRITSLVHLESVFPKCSYPAKNAWIELALAIEYAELELWTKAKNHLDRVPLDFESLGLSAELNHIRDHLKETVDHILKQMDPFQINDFSALEKKLIDLLAIKPRNRFELIEEMYGSNCDFSKAENNIKNLLSRLRKKHPHLIILEASVYRLALSQK